jgi:hypothetical protein
VSVVIINRETTICGACNQKVYINHSQIACREYMRLGFGATSVGVVGFTEKAIENAKRKIRRARRSNP